jgi:phenylacetate-coenzyme A ligase PaaK-like adenylate-forming protein
MPPIGATVSGISWPTLPVGRPAALANLVHELDRTQWYPREAVVAAQFRQLRLLAQVLAVAVPAFRDRLVRVDLRPDDLGTAEGLTRLPPLSRDALVAAGPAAFAAGVLRGHEPITDAKTSGSTGPPVTVKRTAVTGLLWDALTIRDHLWRGIDFQQRVLANRFGVKARIEQQNWGPPVSSLFASAPLEALPLIGPVEALAERCIEFAAEILVVYPSVLDALLAHFARSETRPASLRYVHTYAEPLPRALQAEAEAALGVVVWDTYSCEEIGHIATSCPDGDAYHVVESVLVEVLDDDNRPCPVGAIGRVVVTDLHNVVTPLVRYELGDYAEVAPACPCGRGLPTLGRVVGRAEHRARRPDGNWTWPTTVPLNRYREIAPIEQVQLVQRADGGVDVVAVMDRPPGATAEAALAEVVHAALGHPFPLRFVWRTEPIARTRGGKFEPFRREASTPTR